MMPTNPPPLLDIEPAMRERIVRLADRRKRPAAMLAREALDQYLDREEARLTMHEDGLAAWEEYKADGRHATGEEADRWLARLEDGDDVDPPTCHA